MAREPKQGMHTLGGLYVVNVGLGGTTELRCLSCKTRYFGNLWDFDTLTCEAPSCLDKKKGN